MIVTNSQDKEAEFILSEEADQARRLAVRENAKHIMQESGLADMLKTINRNALKGRGDFEEFDSMILLRWGTGYTRRHMWIEINGNAIRFRLTPHRKCNDSAPLCDGEYHTFTGAMWGNRNLLQDELNKYYAKPVAETSSD